MIVCIILVINLINLFILTTFYVHIRCSRVCFAKANFNEVCEAENCVIIIDASINTFNPILLVINTFQASLNIYTHIYIIVTHFLQYLEIYFSESCTRKIWRWFLLSFWVIFKFFPFFVYWPSTTFIFSMFNVATLASCKRFRYGNTYGANGRRFKSRPRKINACVL